MFVVFVTVFIKQNSVEAFLLATKDNHLHSLQEPGCERFDVLQDTDDSCKFYLYEVYRDKVANAAHKETVHYKRWAETVAGMMASPRSSIKTASLYPKSWS